MRDPVVLIPGLQSDASSWLPLVGIFGLDHAICLPHGHQFEADIGEMARSVLRQSPPRFHLMGWSMGGYIALGILRHAPERIVSLALVATTAGPETPTARARRDRVLQQARAEGLRSYQQANLETCLFDPGAVDPARTGPLIDAADRLGLPALESQTAAIIARPDSRPDLERSRIPLFILAGRDDRVIPPAHAREMHRLRPDAAYHELPDCGHCPPLEAPETVADLYARWIAALPEQARDRSLLE